MRIRKNESEKMRSVGPSDEDRGAAQRGVDVDVDVEAKRDGSGKVAVLGKRRGEIEGRIGDDRGTRKVCSVMGHFALGLLPVLLVAKKGRLEEASGWKKNECWRNRCRCGCRRRCCCCCCFRCWDFQASLALNAAPDEASEN